ncbi:MAG: hypothetical protein P8Q97_06870 [Myxococcota bacterium]|nr:hypothetical protein [Myxococcota bacterium]
MDVAEIIRRAKSQIRKHPGLLGLLQPPAIRATLVLRRMRKAAWYAERLHNQDSTNMLMHDRILKRTPSAFGKMGTLEIELLAHDSKRTSKGERAAMPSELRKHAFVNVGLFPPTDEALGRAFDEIRGSLSDMDILAVFGNAGERELVSGEAAGAEALCGTGGLLPWGAARPWSAALAGKRVLVIHPFVDTVRSQYSKREALWPSEKDVLPEFDLETLRMPLSAGIVEPQEANWTERLHRMRGEMESRSFDVALIGAGGMSLPLAVHAKRLGAIGIHMGGNTQVLFGIRGRRWDNDPAFLKYYNDSWTRPAAEETPEASRNIEDGCYW